MDIHLEYTQIKSFAINKRKLLNNKRTLVLTLKLCVWVIREGQKYIYIYKLL